MIRLVLFLTPITIAISTAAVYGANTTPVPDDLILCTYTGCGRYMPTGQQLTRIADRAAVADYSVSPDGRYLLYSTRIAIDDTDINTDLWLSDLHTGHQRQLYAQRGENPVMLHGWHPQHHEVLIELQSNNTATSASKWLMLSIDGSIAPLLSTTDRNIEWLAWHPTGDALFHHSAHDNDANTVYRLQKQTGDLHPLLNYDRRLSVLHGGAALLVNNSGQVSIYRLTADNVEMVYQTPAEQNTLSVTISRDFRYVLADIDADSIIIDLQTGTKSIIGLAGRYLPQLWLSDTKVWTRQIGGDPIIYSIVDLSNPDNTVDIKLPDAHVFQHNTASHDFANTRYYSTEALNPHPLVLTYVADNKHHGVLVDSETGNVTEVFESRLQPTLHVVSNSHVIYTTTDYVVQVGWVVKHYAAALDGSGRHEFDGNMNTLIGVVPGMARANNPTLSATSAAALLIVSLIFGRRRHKGA